MQRSASNLNYNLWLKQRGMRFAQALALARTPGAETKSLAPRMLLQIDQAALTDSERHLFDRMLAAMKLVRDTFDVQREPDLEKSYTVIVSFENDPGKITSSDQMGETLSIATYHPALLLKDATLKIPAWQHLQAAMRAFNAGR